MVAEAVVVAADSLGPEVALPDSVGPEEAVYTTAVGRPVDTAVREPQPAAIRADPAPARVRARTAATGVALQHVAAAMQLQQPAITKADSLVTFLPRREKTEFR